MKKALITAALLSLVFAVQTFAAEVVKPPAAPAQTFEQRQAHILKMLDERTARLLEEKTCVQAAKNENDLKACREKQMSEMREKRGEMRYPNGMMGGPHGGMGGPQGK